MSPRGSAWVERLCLACLCAAYVQGPLAKLADFDAALAEMAHFGLHPPLLFAAGAAAFELAASALVIAGGRGRAPAALALAVFTLVATGIALRFWEQPEGQERTMAANAFFEHLGLAAAFCLVALHARRPRA